MNRVIYGVIPALLAVTISPLRGDEVTKWNQIASQAPLWEDRIYLLTHLAIHDALNTIERRYERYVLQMGPVPQASPEVAVAAAAYTVLSDQFKRLEAYGFPTQQPVLDAAYASSLASFPDGQPKRSAVGVGTAAAAAILNLRANDGWFDQPLEDAAYPQGTSPGEYRFTPPFNFTFAPKFGTMPTFALQSSHQFRPGAPDPITSDRYTRDFNEIKTLGGDGVSTFSSRTAEQTDIALFWVEGSGNVIWNRLAGNVPAVRRLNLWDNARLFALMNLALVDGYIACWDAKYHYNFWRPVTAIREADTDGNPATTADPHWTPLVETPPIPEYDSGHAVAGSAAATVLRRFFGEDNIAFFACSMSLPAGNRCNDPSPVRRFFTSFSQAARESGLSRIYVGFHFRNSVDEGMKHGQKVAEYVFDHYLRPARHEEREDR
jgi:hypothetical protein